MDYTPEQLDKIKNFTWADDEDAEGAVDHPGYEFAKQTLECAHSIIDYVLENLSTECYENEVFTIAVPTSVNGLIAARYESRWTNESKDAIFEIIRSSFLAIVESDEYKNRITEIVNSVFPGRNMITDWVMLYDDPPSSLEESGQITVEIGVKDR